MKYLSYTLALFLGLTLVAQDNLTNELRKEKMQEKEQERRKMVHAEMLKKYDINKDGKLDKEERSKVSPEDRKKMGPPRKGPKPEKKD